nr:hypothetical protein [Tanacetum cinerariifolium]
YMIIRRSNISVIIVKDIVGESKENDPNLFSLKVNHGGRFSYVYGPKRTRAPRHVYKGGNADWFNDIDVDGFFVIEVLDKGHEPLSKDIDVLDLLSYVRKFKLIELFIKHMVDSCVLDTSVIDLDHEDNRVSDGLESGNVGIENDNVEELDPLFSYLNTNHHIRQSSSDDNDKIDDTEESDESKDSDFECDIEDRIDDVYVDMEMFTKNTDPSEEWVGSTDDIDPNDDEAKRKKALRKLSKGRKPVDGQLYTKNYYVSETFPNKEMIKYMVTRISVVNRRELYLTKKDKERVRAE